MTLSIKAKIKRANNYKFKKGDKAIFNNYCPDSAGEIVTVKLDWDYNEVWVTDSDGNRYQTYRRYLNKMN